MTAARRPSIVVAFDDVLADTAPARHAALRDALAADGITLDDAQLAAACGGRTFHMAVRAARAAAGASDDDHTAVAIAAARADRAFAGRFRRATLLRPGAAAFARDAAAVAAVALVAWTPRRDVALTLELAALDAAFSFVITADEFPDDAPADAPWTLAAARLERSGNERRAVALAGAAVAIDAARQAGLRPVAVGGLDGGAFRADRWIPTLEGASAADLLAHLAPVEPR
ncbi:MAG: hypothetical protein HY084_05865 [Gemmatimonadetes bacterium]|nr:hypothetical protein [Gemmatimonadota bacterium]